MGKSIINNEKQFFESFKAWLRDTYNESTLWNDGIRDSLIATGYWTLGLMIISLILYRYVKIKHNYIFTRLVKRVLFFQKSKFNGVYYSKYYYNWPIDEDEFKASMKKTAELLNKKTSKDMKTGNNLIELLQSDIEDYSEYIKKALKCIDDIKRKSTTYKLETESELAQLEKDFKRKNNEIIIIREVIEIIIIGNTMYGFVLPNNICSDSSDKGFRKIRKNSKNQSLPVELKEQNNEFRLLAKKHDNNNRLFIGYWVDPNKFKVRSGSVTFIDQGETTDIEGSWLGRNKVTRNRIDSGSWVLEKEYDSSKQYFDSLK